MYVSIDIETTGLDRAKDQILEVAAVLLPEDATDPQAVCEFPYFHCAVRHERLSGSVVALSMNSRLVKRLSDIEKGKDDGAIPWVWPSNLGPHFTTWLNSFGLTAPRSLTPLGQNVGSFDMPFLRRLANFPDYRFHYRSCEVGSLFATRSKTPSLSSIAIGFEIPGSPHEALYDARLALAAAMTKWRNDERGWE
jgi:DNA polymerase III epsilon subunit-like protein